MRVRICVCVRVLSKVYSQAWHAAKARQESPEACGQLARDARLQYLSIITCATSHVWLQVGGLTTSMEHLRWVIANGSRDHPLVQKYLKTETETAVQQQ